MKKLKHLTNTYHYAVHIKIVNELLTLLDRPLILKRVLTATF